MVISSTLLALNLHSNLEEVTNAEYCVICVVQDFIEEDFVPTLGELLNEKNLGRVLPIIKTEDEVAFSVILEDLSEGIKALKRSLRESGVFLSTKIVLTTPEVRMLKDFGEVEINTSFIT
jgi:hypothetical protein